MDAKKLIKQCGRNRFLQTLAYLASFPLLIICVFVGSVSFMGEGAFGDTQYYGVIVCALAWLVVTLFQIIVAIITKNHAARAVIVVIVTLIIMAGGAFVFDMWAEGKVDDARIAYVRDVNGLDDEVEVKVDAKGYSYVVGEGEEAETITGTLSIKNYANQINSYVPWTKKTGLVDDYNKLVDEFCRVYNVGFTSSVKGSVNTDGTKFGDALVRVNDEGEDVTEYWFGEEGAVYKQNGLYADGYIFSMPVAMEILATYYETQELYAADGKNADVELEKALDEVAKSTKWKNYMKTEEYQKAYGVGGTADSYMITLPRLDKIVRVLGNGLYEQGIYSLVFEGVIGGLVGGLLGDVEINENMIKNLTLEQVITLVQGFGLEFTEEDIMGLLADFSSYQVSDVLPKMYFIEDETLRAYAYAKYYGETHGANIGSVLIPSVTTDESGNVSYGNIGLITMNDSGVSYEENAFSLDEIYLLRAQNSYVPTLYPLFAARRYAYIFAGIIALMMVLFYYAQMKVYVRGKRLQKTSILQGGTK